MARQASISVENNFSRGLITEFSKINFPESAATEIWDCIIELDSKVIRRGNFEFETDPENTKTIDRSQSVVRSYYWKNVENSLGSFGVLVVQVGDTLYYYEGETPISANAIADTTDLTSFIPSGSTFTPDNIPCHFTEGNGLLFVTHPLLDAFHVEYNPTITPTVTETQIDPEIRDFEGLDDGLEIDERPTSTIGGLSGTHHYNLFNQGWHFNSNAALTAWDAARSDMPSNADAWWYYKDSNGDWADAEVARFDPGNTPAPKGHYTLNVFEEDRSTASGVGSITVVSTDDQRFSTSAFYAGRKFYSGIQQEGYTNRIYFTQIVLKDEQYDWCYQANDPTNESFPDLLSSDGGTLHIPDSGDIIKLFVMQHFLLVFTTLGVWAVSGSEGIGFAANDFVVTKVTDVPCISQSSFVSVEGAPMWWNEAGIYTLVPSGGLQFQVQSLTDQSIKSFYEEIPSSSKTRARGAYNRNQKVVQWLYQSEEESEIEGAQEYDRVLNFSVQLNAFYPWSISSSDVKVHDVFVVEKGGGQIRSDQVIDGSSDTVVDANSDDVVVFNIEDQVEVPTFKYLVSYASGGSHEFSLAEATKTRYLDFFQYDDTGVNYESYLITGYKVRGDAMRQQQSNYVQVFLDREDDASCIVQGLWDWAANSDSGKFSSTQQAYSSRRNNFDVVFRRLKLRGKGRSLQVKFSSEQGKPFTLLGWAAFDTVNAEL